MGKSLLLVFFAVLTALSASAQDTKECLSALRSVSQAYEFTYYGNGKVHTRANLASGYSDVVDTLYYDAQWRNTRKSAFQFYAELGYEVNRVNYTYNESGLLATRDNYNTYNGPLQASAHIVYEYDNKGRMSKQTQYWARDLEHPFTYMTYGYDPYNGKVNVMNQYAQDNYDETKYDLSEKIVYKYDNLGNPLSKTSYYYSWGSMSVSGSEEYYYDYDGNIEKVYVKDYNGDTKSILTYEYDKTVLAADIVYPKTNEYDVLKDLPIKHKRLRERLQELKNGEFVETIVTEYEYSSLPDGIEEIRNEKLEMRNSCFNLNGQCVNNSAKGIVIVNGKKVVR